MIVKKSETLEEWLQNTEPKYRSNNGYYPKDWEMRKNYIKKKYNYKCASCGSENEYTSQWYAPYKFKFFCHHIVSIKEGGDNSLENLILLCEECHNKIHPHMKDHKVSAVHFPKNYNNYKKPK